MEENISKPKGRSPNPGYPVSSGLICQGLTQRKLAMPGRGSNKPGSRNEGNWNNQADPTFVPGFLQQNSRANAGRLNQQNTRQRNGWRNTNGQSADASQAQSQSASFQQPAPEFNIDREEDFPALPSTQIPPEPSTNGRKSPSKKRSCMQYFPDGTVANIPPSMINDQFGMAGILASVTEHDSNPVERTLTHGINIESEFKYLTESKKRTDLPKAELYHTFSPFAEAPSTPQDLDYPVPPEYMTNIHIRKKLAPIQTQLEHYGEDLLFYLFYMFHDKAV